MPARKTKRALSWIALLAEAEGKSRAAWSRCSSSVPIRHVHQGSGKRRVCPLECNDKVWRIHEDQMRQARSAQLEHKSFGRAGDTFDTARSRPLAVMPISAAIDATMIDQLQLSHRLGPDPETAASVNVASVTGTRPQPPRSHECDFNHASWRRASCF